MVFMEQSTTRMPNTAREAIPKRQQFRRSPSSIHVFRFISRVLMHSCLILLESD